MSSEEEKLRKYEEARLWAISKITNVEIMKHVLSGHGQITPKEPEVLAKRVTVMTPICKELTELFDIKPEEIRLK